VIGVQDPARARESFAQVGTPDLGGGVLGRLGLDYLPAHALAAVDIQDEIEIEAHPLAGG
jgi:hypothetical protein